MIVARILGWILVVAALAVAAMGLALRLGGQNFAMVAGQLWYQLDEPSLSRTQDIAQSIHPALWAHVVLPLLQESTRDALLISFIVPFTLGVALIVLCRRRNKRRRFN